jgi:hypothetical protein
MGANVCKKLGKDKLDETVIKDVFKAFAGKDKQLDREETSKLLKQLIERQYALQVS